MSLSRSPSRSLMLRALSILRPRSFMRASWSTFFVWCKEGNFGSLDLLLLRPVAFSRGSEYFIFVGFYLDRVWSVRATWCLNKSACSSVNSKDRSSTRLICKLTRHLISNMSSNREEAFSWRRIFLLFIHGMKDLSKSGRNTKLREKESLRVLMSPASKS